MSKYNPSNPIITPEKLQERINDLRNKMVETTQHVTDEIFKSMQSADGPILDVNNEEYKVMINSLLNEDTRDPVNPGKEVVSLKNTELEIEESLDKMIIENNIVPHVFSDLKKEMGQIRKNYENQVLTNEGLQELIDTRLHAPLNSPVPMSQEKLNEQINYLRKDMMDMTGFITQEFIKSAQANDGKLLDANSTRHKRQVNSLLNADPRSPENHGKPVLSIKSTELSIEARLDDLVMEKGVAPSEFNSLKNEIGQIKKDFENKALSNTGLKELVDTRIKGNLLLQNAVQFMKVGVDGKPTGMTPGEKQQVINQIKDYVTITDTIRSAYLNSDKTKGEKIAAITTTQLAQAFSKEGNNDKGFSTLDPAKLNPKNIERFKQSWNDAIKKYELEEFKLHKPQSIQELTNNFMQNGYEVYFTAGKGSDLGKLFDKDQPFSILLEMTSKRIENLEKLQVLGNERHNDKLIEEELKELKAIKKSFKNLKNDLSEGELNPREAINEFLDKDNLGEGRSFTQLIKSIIYKIFPSKYEKDKNKIESAILSDLTKIISAQESLDKEVKIKQRNFLDNPVEKVRELMVERSEILDNTRKLLVQVYASRPNAEVELNQNSLSRDSLQTNYISNHNNIPVLNEIAKINQELNVLQAQTYQVAKLGDNLESGNKTRDEAFEKFANKVAEKQSKDGLTNEVQALIANINKGGDVSFLRGIQELKNSNKELNQQYAGLKESAAVVLDEIKRNNKLQKAGAHQEQVGTKELFNKISKGDAFKEAAVASKKPKSHQERLTASREKDKLSIAEDKKSFPSRF